MPDSCGVADRGRGARLGHRDHQVGLDRVLAGQRAAHLDAGLVHAAAGDGGVGAGQVDVLEDAALGRRPRRSAASAGRPRRWRSARRARPRGSKRAPTMSSAAVSEATTQPRSSRPSTSGRMPCGSRAAYRVCSSMKTKQKAPRSRGSTSSAAASRVRSGSSGEQRGDQGGVGGVAAGAARRGAASSPSAAVDQVAQLGGVDQVAVVGQRDRAVGRGAEGRLGVLPGGAAGGGVAAVADREVAASASAACVSSKTWETRPMSL